MPINWTDPRYRTVVEALRALHECTGRPMKGFLIPERGIAQAANEKD